jgi:hypothetical protein
MRASVLVGERYGNLLGELQCSFALRKYTCCRLPERAAGPALGLPPRHRESRRETSAVDDEGSRE